MPVFMHTRVRVSDLDRSSAFYCDHLGFKVRNRNERSPHGNQTCNLEMEGSEHLLELTYSPDYELAVPEDLMHFAIGVSNLTAFCEDLETKGIEIWPDKWREEFKNLLMAFINDPDGYEIELLQRP
ncbi:MAG TPA: VOC family protein [Chloroflexota bacterium]|nr:VOC family protein [Chloroflexota bacterium]